MKVVSQRDIEGLERFEGVLDIAKDGAGIAFDVDADKMGEVITHLTGFGIVKLDIAPPALEDLFMKHYRRD